MKIIVLQEKHCNVYMLWSDDATQREEICRKILLRRIKDGWFTEEDKAQEALDTNTCFRFMSKRRNYEYEEFSIENITE